MRDTKIIVIFITYLQLYAMFSGKSCPTKLKDIEKLLLFAFSCSVYEPLLAPYFIKLLKLLVILDILQLETPLLFVSENLKILIGLKT